MGQCNISQLIMTNRKYTLLDQCLLNFLSNECSINLKIIHPENIWTCLAPSKLNTFLWGYPKLLNACLDTHNIVKTTKYFLKR